MTTTTPAFGFHGHAAPLWCWVVLGWTLVWAGARWWEARSGDAVVGPAALVLPEGVVAPASGARRPWPAHDVDWDLDVMGPRQLRALPEVGRKRALDIAVERWRQGATRAVGEGRGAFDLTVVPGIGAATAAAARAGATRFRAESGPREVAP